MRLFNVMPTEHWDPIARAPVDATTGWTLMRKQYRITYLSSWEQRYLTTAEDVREDKQTQ
jgi:hypothetical protein